MSVHPIKVQKDMVLNLTEKNSKILQINILYF